jgi:hypothetical protein
MARRVGVKIRRAETEFMMAGKWSSSLEVRVSTGTINRVQDFKYLGSWLLDCTKDLEEYLYSKCDEDKAFSNLCGINFSIQFCHLDSY